MVRIGRFENIKAWQIARELVDEVYKISGQDNFAKDFGLRDQIRRAEVSIMFNVSEGFERRSNYAKGSAAEVKSQLYVAVDQGYIEENSFRTLYGKCTDISKLIMGFISFLKKK